jgi:hypothetical protein
LEDHPIVKGITNIWGPADVYGLTTLNGDSKPLVLGQVAVGMGPKDVPNNEKEMVSIAWTKMYTGTDGKSSSVFTTTMGHSGDFKNEGFCRLLINACYGFLGMDKEILEKSSVDLVGDYNPHPLGVGVHKK